MGEPFPTFLSLLMLECEPTLRYIEKDYFSLLKLLYYTRELGYLYVDGFYYQDVITKKFHVLKSDQHLLNQIKDLKYEDIYEVFVLHSLDHDLIDPEGLVGLLTGPKVSSSEIRSLNEVVGAGVGVNLDEEGVGEATNLAERVVVRLLI
ncbi:hypothetical protein RND71_009887 [Anisodus tanguticus]|uniref:Uncharacterized protein n=1 Tax=Anisodus tanguticus TaxID=243964 RepID=A0AAE1SJ81_9SOLA|nr:hypothetical protein RND71_009887 [Anisodus tanguticus]